MDNSKTITILGAGYVGLTTAALLSHAGYTAYVVEPNHERLDVIKSGRSFFFENGIDPVISAGIKNGTLIPTDSYEESVSKSSIVFSCVGTPDNPNGSSNLSYVFSAAEETAKYLQPGGIYVQKSTVPVGTGEKIERLFKDLEANYAYISNPEFLREGTAVYDTLFFDRVVAGGNDISAVETILSVYSSLEKNRGHIAAVAGIKEDPRKGMYIATSLNSAELIKVTANAFLALKISFANSIAKLADSANADVKEVMDAVGADERIGRAFLNAGRGYGGGCFPKDVSGLIASALSYGVDMPLMEVAQQVNNSMVGYIIEKLEKNLGSTVEGKTIAVLGLAFKAGTSDVRKSPGIRLATELEKRGATVKTFDPQAKEEASHELSPIILQQDSIDDALVDSDAAVIATEWSEFKDYPAKLLVQYIKGRKPLLIDAVNVYEKKTAEAAGLRYVGVGR